MADDEEINRVITNSLFSSDCHIREHIADIIGEKRLFSAGDALNRQLMTEDNYYTAVSIIEAIGKLDRSSDIVYIEKWLDEHEKDIVNCKMFSVFRHARNAIIRLDTTPEGIHRNMFAQKYDKYITERVPL